MAARRTASAWRNWRTSSATSTVTCTWRTTCSSRKRLRSNVGPGLIAPMTETDVRAALRDVLDPELGINIVDLGLVYGIDITGGNVRITMTMTTPACPLRDYLQDLVASTVTSRLADARHVAVDIVS